MISISSFEVINPDAKKTITERLEYLKSKDDNIVDEIRYELKNIFFQEDLFCKVEGRIKSPYSIWNKIKNKNISFEQLSDIMAFRVITNSTRECYRCLGIIHRQYPYIQGRFKDFISAPKSNGYRALHTSVMGPKNKKIEIFIYGTDSTLKISEDINCTTPQSFNTVKLKLETLKKGTNKWKILKPKKTNVGKWRVEEEFINAIKGKEKITHTTFSDGVKYMQFTDALKISSDLNKKVFLPL